MLNITSKLSKELEKHAGEWVALENDKLIAFGNDADDVYKRAKKICKDPILFKIPTKEDTYILGIF